MIKEQLLEEEEDSSWCLNIDHIGPPFNENEKGLGGEKKERTKLTNLSFLPNGPTFFMSEQS